jgi:hypothetical protein
MQDGCQTPIAAIYVFSMAWILPQVDVVLHGGKLVRVGTAPAYKRSPTLAGKEFSPFSIADSFRAVQAAAPPDFSFRVSRPSRFR